MKREKGQRSRKGGRRRKTTEMLPHHGTSQYTLKRNKLHIEYEIRQRQSDRGTGDDGEEGREKVATRQRTLEGQATHPSSFLGDGLD